MIAHGVQPSELRGLGPEESYVLLEALDKIELQKRHDRLQDMVAANGEEPSSFAKQLLMSMLTSIYEGREQEIAEQLEALSRRG